MHRGLETAHAILKIVFARKLVGKIGTVAMEHGGENLCVHSWSSASSNAYLLSDTLSKDFPLPFLTTSIFATTRLILFHTSIQSSISNFNYYIEMESVIVLVLWESLSTLIVLWESVIVLWNYNCTRLLKW